MSYEDDIAEAGDQYERKGSTYSRVGDDIYRKTLFGWEKVEDDEEEAEAGDIREANGSTYSIVGNTVYRKDLFGWEEVDDEEERAEAGDQYERNGATYSRVGNYIYEKTLFGWDLITEFDDDDPDENPDDDDEESTHDNTDVDYSESESEYSSYENYDYNYKSESKITYQTTNTTATSSSISFQNIAIGIFIFCIILFIAIKVLTCQTTPQTQQPVYTNYNPVVNTQPVRPVNPFGEGNGAVSIYKTCTYCGETTVYYEGQFLGKLPAEPLRLPPRNSESLVINIPAGKRIFTFKNEDGKIWTQKVKVIEGQCIYVKSKNNSGWTINTNEYMP